MEDFVAVGVDVIPDKKGPTPEADVSAVSAIISCGDVEAQLEIGVDQTRCRRGYRRWLVCPCCGSRRVYLLVDGLALACRTCLGAAYASQRRWPWISMASIKRAASA